MITFPHAKINLGLRILGRRPDGYHNIQTLMYPIPLCDLLEVIPSEQGMRYDFGSWCESPEENLVVKAYRKVEEARHISLPPVEIILRKKIPTGAGLGGGSSDATSMIRLLDELFSLHLTKAEQHAIATSLGADCPFFLTHEPQIAEGIGEQLSPFPLSLEGKHLTLLHSAIHVSTKEAYQGVGPTTEGMDIREALSLPLEQWREVLYNQFEPNIFRLYPELARGKELLYNAGATYAAMSGSGSTLFAISHTPLSVEGWSGMVQSYQL